MNRSLLAGAACLTLFCCAAPRADEPAGGGGGGGGGPAPADTFATVAVHYLTDRARRDVPGPEDLYSGERGSRPQFGRALVSIPRRHKTGVLEEPPFFLPDFLATPERYVLILYDTRLTDGEALADLRAAVRSSSENALLIFVHGFNVSHDEAVRRTAQLSWDLGFPGAPLTFSWPSDGSIAPLGYTADLNDAEWASSHLAALFATTIRELAPERIFLIAHSMGNRVVAGALGQLARTGTSLPPITNVVLAAPDLDAEVFARDIYPAIRPLAEKMSLYVSANDLALKASREVGGGYPRLGDPTDGVIVLPDLETVDVSAVDVVGIGHSYFGDSPEVLGDLLGLLRQRLPAPGRQLLAARSASGAGYWRLQP